MYLAPGLEETNAPFDLLGVTQLLDMNVLVAVVRFTWFFVNVFTYGG